jgi:2-iminobutanoate/2-iminopropanoate deaminase
MCKCCEKSVIKTDKAPKAIGPYSVGIQGGHFVFTSGQIGLDPSTGNMVEGGIESQTRRVLMNLENVLEAAGSGLINVVKVTVFLQDLGDFGKMNEVYSNFFTENPPARSTVQVAGLPRGAAVEIEVVAIVPCKEGDCDCN